MELTVDVPNAGGWWSPSTYKDAFLEVWFVGASRCVSVTKKGWVGSAVGPRPKGDEYAGDYTGPCVLFERVELKGRFVAENVWVPAPPEGQSTALCVDLVHTEFASPKERSKCVFRRKAFACVVGERAPLLATHDVPLVLRPIALLPAEEGWRWEPQEHDYLGRNRSKFPWCTPQQFTLVRGYAQLKGVLPQMGLRPPPPQRLYEAYAKHRAALEEWAGAASWRELGEKCGGRDATLPARMRDLPTMFPSRVSPHVPNAMAGDLSVQPFLATPAWWASRVRAVLRRLSLSEEDFLRSNDCRRTACVAMRAAKLWACSRLYVHDQMVVGTSLKENDMYLDLRVAGGGDCDDFALCVYRCCAALASLKDQEPLVQKCADAMSEYQPFLCTGLYHSSPLSEREDEMPAPGTVKEYAHAFVVAFPKAWVSGWMGYGLKKTELVPLLGDGTCWPDPCMDGGCAACLGAERAEKRAALVKALLDENSEVVRDAIRRMEQEDQRALRIAAPTVEDILTDFTAQQLEGIRKRVLEGIADIERGDYTEYEGQAGLKDLAKDVVTRGRERMRKQA